jgi:hypothetical protein
MPYIKQIARADFAPVLNEISSKITEVTTEGDMNYMITRMVLRYLETHGTNYTNINGMIGMLECTKLELYRRLAAPYENKKVDENGDVYPQK